MTDRGFLSVSDAERSIINETLSRIVPDAHVWAFGSRVTGAPKPYSDLDLCIDAGNSLGLDRLSALDEAFAESDLPWKVDIVDWATTSEAFRAIIKGQRVLLQP